MLSLKYDEELKVWMPNWFWRKKASVQNKELDSFERENWLDAKNSELSVSEFIEDPNLNEKLPPISSPVAKNISISQLLEYEKSRNLYSKGKTLLMS